jgi:hypothetical protein
VKPGARAIQKAGATDFALELATNLAFQHSGVFRVELRPREGRKVDPGVDAGLDE